MGTRKHLDQDVFLQAIDRMTTLYQNGHRIVVAFSAGKDSGVCLEICLIAAEATNRLPVEVVMRDEEIMYPGTFEYAERVAARPNVDFHWLIANQPVVNIYNRAMPYFWTFDPLLEPDQWVRRPPAIAKYITDLNIQKLISTERFPPPPGKDLITVLGLRTSESRSRLLGLHSSKGYLTQKSKLSGSRCARPIYDWTDGDVWRAHREFQWDYNSAYDIMVKMGIPTRGMRIAPPTLNHHGTQLLQMGSRAWPKWFSRVANRLPGVRAGAHFGLAAVQPVRKSNETWEQCFKRECIEEAPGWIAERATHAMTMVLQRHNGHSALPLPQNGACSSCGANLGSWKLLATNMYGGDPFSLKCPSLPYIEPEFFRVGAGCWNGTPAFA